MNIIPNVSKWEFHPFSVSSSPHHDNGIIFIKVCQHWTKQLSQSILSPISQAVQQKQIEEQNSEPNDDKQELLVPSIPKFFVSGPYGSSIDYTRFRGFLLIAGGIGITPIQAHYNSIIHSIRRGENCLSLHHQFTFLHLVWTAKWIKVQDSSNSSSNTANHGRPLLPPAFSSSILSEIHSSPADEEQKSSESSLPLIKTDFHVTNLPASLASQPDQYRSQFTAHLSFGRPDIANLLHETSQFASQQGIQPEFNGQNAICVISCGPTSLNNQVKSLCKRWNKQGKQLFWVHQDEFQL
jgi:hypothetical protein